MVYEEIEKIINNKNILIFIYFYIKKNIVIELYHI